MKKKKILVLYQYFRHPGEPGGTRFYWLAKKMMDEGYDVTVLTQKNSFNDENKNAPFHERVLVDGITVVYIKNAYANSFSYFKRVSSYLKFMFFSLYYAWKEKDVDLVLASSTPITIGIPAIILYWFKRKPFIFEIRDLWPEIPVQMGAIKNKLLITFLRKLEAYLYRKSVHVVALSPGQKEGVEWYVPGEKVTVISNMAKIDKFWDREKNWAFAEKLGLRRDTFKVVHFGTMGAMNGLDNVVDTAKLIKEKGITDIELILVGSGGHKEKFKKRQKEEQLDSLIILDRMAMSDISELVNLSDVSYVGIKPVKIVETNSANKFFDSLSAGKPLILNYGGWMADIINENQCGIRIHPTDPQAFLDAILTLKADPQRCQSMGLSSRKLAETRFDKSILTQQYADLIGEVFKNKIH
jgi:glycosyltransferase involved in cell wall biosynthesis